MNLDAQKKVLITGAQGGLGQQVIHRFLKEGLAVTGVLHSSDKLQHQSASGAQWISLDLTQSEDVKTVFSQRSFDILIHCAGGFRFGKVDELSDTDLDFLLDVNLRSSFYLVRELLPAMKKRNFGRIVFISSASTLNPGAGMAAYLASKAGLNILTASLTEELKDFDITVNALLPSIIDTEANRRAMPNADFSSWVTPAQLTEIIHTLVTPVGNPIRGALIPVKGRV